MTRPRRRHLLSEQSANTPAQMQPAQAIPAEERKSKLPTGPSCPRRRGFQCIRELQRSPPPIAFADTQTRGGCIVHFLARTKSATNAGKHSKNRGALHRAASCRWSVIGPNRARRGRIYAPQISYDQCRGPLWGIDLTRHLGHRRLVVFTDADG